MPPLPRRGRHDGPFSMDLVNNPRAWGVNLLKNALIWEVPRFATGALVRWRYGKGASASAKEKEFVDGAASYIVSAAHAVVISGFGLKILSLLWPTPEADKFYVNDGMKDLSTIDLIERTNWLFFGYMMDDLFHVLAQYPNLGKWDMVLHHLVFIACAVLAGGTQIFVFPFAWLLVGELSTPSSPSSGSCARWPARTARRWFRSRSPRDEAGTCAEATARWGSSSRGRSSSSSSSIGVCVYGAGLAPMAHYWKGTFARSRGREVGSRSFCWAGLNAYWFES